MSSQQKIDMKIKIHPDNFDNIVYQLCEEFKDSWKSKTIDRKLLIELMSFFIIVIEKRYKKGEFKHELVLAILKKIVTDTIHSEDLQKELYLFIDGPVSVMIGEACKFVKISFKKINWKNLCCSCCKN